MDAPTLWLPMQCNVSSCDVCDRGAHKHLHPRVFPSPGQINLKAQSMTPGKMLPANPQNQLSPRPIVQQHLFLSKSTLLYFLVSAGFLTLGSDHIANTLAAMQRADCGKTITKPGSRSPQLKKSSAKERVPKNGHRHSPGYH